MNRKRRVMLGGATVVMAALMAPPARCQAVQAPRFEVDLLWPKPMPNRWILGSVVGVAVDSRDHIYVLNRTDTFAATENSADANPPTGECCHAAPNVVEFDAAGSVVGSWGPGAGYVWPAQNTGIGIDNQGNVWIGSVGGADSHMLKFTRDGKFLATIGKVTTAADAAAAPADTAYAGVSGAPRAAPFGCAVDTGGRGGRGGGGGRGGRGGGRGAAPPMPANSASRDAFGGPAGISFDPNGTEAYVADGSRNRRVAVVDVATGTITRYWGAYGSQPSDAPQSGYRTGAPAAKQFSSVACAEVSKDGMVYVCDRGNHRIQVFKKDGSFVKEKVIAPVALPECAPWLGLGTVWDVTFSRDAQQKYLYVADGINNKIWILDRQSLDVLTSFGDGGRIPGEFYAVSGVATDSKGNLYTVESLQGKRLQKFTFKGVGAVPAQPKAVLWPGSGQ